MPNVDASRCWSRSSKWCWSRAWPWPPARALGLRVGGTVTLGNVSLLLADDPGVRRVLVRLLVDHHRVVEVEGGRRRGGRPLQPLRAPRVGPRLLAVEQRVEEVAERQEVADTQDRGAGGREHVPHLELGRVLTVAARHAEGAEDDLREEGQVEADEDEQR